MHIPDAVLDPRTLAVTGAIAAGGLAYGVSRLKGQLRDRTTVLMGITSACVFAAQMVNFHILVLPVSGHLLGGVLAAVMLGPWAGSCVIATVLVVQCLLCGDGGLTALGANFVNMGLLGSVVGYAIYAPIRRAIGGHRGVLIGAMAAAWFSVLLASGAFAVELAASGRRDDFLNVLGWMVLIHAAIGLGEAIITGLVIRFVLQVRPDLIYEAEEEAPRVVRWGQVAVAGLGVAMAVAIFLAPLASEFPDGLEAVGTRLNFVDEEHAPAPIVPAPIRDYEMPGLDWKPLATASAGAVGTLIVFGVGLTLARAFASGKGPSSSGSPRMRPDLAGLERLAESPGPLRRIDARIKIVATVAFVVGVVATPPGTWWVLGIEAAILALIVVVSRVPVGYILTRWLGFLLLVAFLAAMVAQAHPDRDRLGWWAVWGAVLTKNSLAFVAVLTLAATTPMRRLLAGLGRLGVPAVLVSTLHFMIRYLHVLSDELARMVLARRSRTFRRSGRLDWGLLTGLIGMLLIRSFERGERVHAAMLARGWDGTIRSLDDRDGPEAEAVPS